MHRNTSGFIPPFLLYRLAARHPETATLYTDAITQTARLWIEGQGVIHPVGAGNGERKIHDGQNRTSLPGKLVRPEGSAPVSDAVINKLYDYTGDMRGLLSEIFHRNSIDGNGMPIVATGHYGRSYNNAFWNGSQFACGDGDGVYFATFVLSDVIGHEMFHGVIEFTSGLEYYGQSGALNEHGADFAGAVIKQFGLKQTADKADWLIGQGLWTPTVKGRALRDMLNPGTAYDDPNLGKDPQPAHMKDYVDTWNDNGGVHYNSGIPNRAFALFARALGGYAWEKAGLIWFLSITSKQLPRNAKFQQFADLTVATAAANFPETVAALRDAWKAVGITPAK